VRLALDTNILAYAEGVNGAPMRSAALELIQKLPEGTTLLPVQTLGELFNLLVRKARRPPAKARKAILTWRDAGMRGIRSRGLFFPVCMPRTKEVCLLRLAP
jgi:predicted nucleic acid-binding protein